MLPISDYPKFEAIRYIEAKRGQGSIQMWNEHKIDITKKTSNSYEVKADDILRAASAAAKQPSAYLPDHQFLRALGTEDVESIPRLQLRVRYHLELQKSGKDVFARIRLSLLHQAQEGWQELPS